MSEENILNIKRLKITCTTCKSGVQFDIDAPHKFRPLYSCPICGEEYGIDPNDDTIERAKSLLHSVKIVKNATFSFLCENKEISKTSKRLTDE